MKIKIRMFTLKAQLIPLFDNTKLVISVLRQKKANLAHSRTMLSTCPAHSRIIRTVGKVSGSMVLRQIQTASRSNLFPHPLHSNTVREFQFEDDYPSVTMRTLVSTFHSQLQAVYIG